MTRERIDYERIKKLAEELHRPASTLIALISHNDPFYVRRANSRPNPKSRFYPHNDEEEVMTDKQNQIAVIEELREDHHAFYSKEGVRRFTEPFDFMGTTQIEQSEPWEPGGLRFHDTTMTQAPGQDARWIATRSPSISVSTPARSTPASIFAKSISTSAT